MNFSRVLLIVLDSVGIGEMPDAAAYGDAGSDTLGHVLTGRLTRLPVLESLGLGHIRPLRGVKAAPTARGAYGKCALQSDGKDTTTGHWEMAGVLLHPGFPTFPQGFPIPLVSEFEHRIGRKTLGNVAASGTEIIQKLGSEHVRSGSPILYTSADSVFQLAAHEEVIPLDELYRMCAIARALCQGPYRVGRVIARPFLGDVAHGFQRTRHRHDYAVPPPPGMLLDALAAAGIEVYGVGKISDIFLGRGIRRSVPMDSNADGMRKTRAAMRECGRGLIFVNLVDFDMLYGHRNDLEGYGRALEEFDRDLAGLLGDLLPTDFLILTADHGCDPTSPSTDHSREYVPLLAYRRGIELIPLGTRATLADIGQTIARNFGVPLAAGSSFLKEVSRSGAALAVDARMP